VANVVSKQVELCQSDATKLLQFNREALELLDGVTGEQDKQLHEALMTVSAAVTYTNVATFEGRS
jgi:hypothetical protein